MASIWQTIDKWFQRCNFNKEQRCPDLDVALHRIKELERELALKNNNTEHKQQDEFIHSHHCRCIDIKKINISLFNVINNKK